MRKKQKGNSHSSHLKISSVIILFRALKDRSSGHANTFLPKEPAAVPGVDLSLLQMDSRKEWQINVQNFLMKQAEKLHSKTLSLMATKVGKNVYNVLGAQIKPIVDFVCFLMISVDCLESLKKYVDLHFQTI